LLIKLYDRASLSTRATGILLEKRAQPILKSLKLVPNGRLIATISAAATHPSNTS